MKLISLQSGSSGNCVYVESGGVRLLFDAGLNPTQIERRLGLHQVDPRSLDGIVISHNHSDHVRFATSSSRKFGIPLYITEPTLRAARHFVSAEKCEQIQIFRSGASLRFGEVTVNTVCTPHDAVDGVVFEIDDGIHRLGVCTDVGHVFSDLASLVGRADALFLESNYDEGLLAGGRYPAFLKRRIAGPGGHISNREAAEVVSSHATSRLQWLCLAHLSGENNSVERALEMHRTVLRSKLPIHVTSRRHATQAIEVGGGQLAFDF